MTITTEAGLYDPVKALLESQGYEVKGEIGAADVVGVRENDPPVVVELKLRFSLALFHQAVARLSVTDVVYIAVLRRKTRNARRIMRDNKSMCRRLGLGLILVGANGRAEVVCDPAPYAPRKSKVRTERLLGEFQKRRGDPNTGGSTRHGLVTAYRQDALACARYLSENGTAKGSVVAQAVGVDKATRLMRDNHYGWFQRVSVGLYGLTESGSEALERWKNTPS